MDTNKLKAQLAAMQDEINRTAEQYGLGGHLQYMMNGGEIHQLPVAPYGFAEDGSKAYMSNTKVYSPEELKSMPLNQATSIVDAMKLMGDDSSFANRKKMAESMGINGYTGTEDQNKELVQKYYASKRQFAESDSDDNIQSLLSSGTEDIAPMQSRSAQPIPTMGMQRPIPQAPMSGSDIRMRTLDDLGPRENTPARFNVSRTPIDNSLFIAGPPNRPMDPDMVTQEMDLPEVTVMGSKKVAPKQPVPAAKPTPAKKPVSTPNKPILNTTNFNSLSGFNKTTQEMIKEAAKRNNGKVFITDKGTKSTIVGTVKNGKVELQAFPVLTGEYDKPGMYADSYSYDKLEGSNDKTLRRTPTGAFALDKHENIYGEPGFFLRGLDDAYHVTYPEEFAQRNPKYTDPNINNNNMSYGCINGRCGDIATLTKMFNTGDSSYIIDTRLPYNQNVKMINTNQHKKIKEMGGMNSNQSDMYFAGGEIENDPHIMELYGFQGGGQIMEIPVAPYGYAQQGMEIPVAPYGYNEQGGMNYEDGGQMPMDVAVSRFKAAGRDKGLSGGELQVYVEKMKSKYNYQKGGVVKEQELGNYEVGMYGSGGIMYNGTKFPGYNKAINTAPGDKFKKQVILQKGGKIKLVKFGHR